jgi:hypothetical protein
MADQIVYAVEQIDKGVWELVNRTANTTVHTFPSRATARAALDQLKNGASEEEAIAGKTAKTSRSVKSSSSKSKTATKAKTAKTSNKSVRRENGSEQPTAFALKKRAKNFDAMRDAKGNLPVGLLDVFNPRNSEGFVCLYHTLSVQGFDTSQIGTTYVLRDEVSGETVEVSDKREGRLAASKINENKPVAKKPANKKKSVSAVDSAEPTSSVENNPPF